MFGSGNNHFRISISDLKQRRAFSLKCFLPGNVVADLNIKLLAASLSNKVDFLLIELADIDIISTAKKLDANDVFIYSAIIHISASQYCISNTAVTQIELFRAFKVFLASDVVSLNIIKYKSIAQILNVLADGYMIGWSLICCQQLTDLITNGKNTTVRLLILSIRNSLRRCKTKVSGRVYFCTKSLVTIVS
mgnify:CR=1 FL=1